MKKEALSRGAEVTPISWTFGMLAGMGVVSTRTCRLKLEGVSIVGAGLVSAEHTWGGR